MPGTTMSEILSSATEVGLSRCGGGTTLATRSKHKQGYQASAILGDDARLDMYEQGDSGGMARMPSSTLESQMPRPTVSEI